MQVSHTAGPSCALRTEGSIVCWNPSRPEYDAVMDAPEGVFTQVAAGVVHACAIRLGGTVACWGENSDKPRLINCDPCTT